MTLADLPTFHVELGSFYGVWVVEERVAKAQWLCVCRNCGMERILSRRHLQRYAGSTCYYTRCREFSVHHLSPTEQAKWLLSPSRATQVIR